MGAAFLALFVGSLLMGWIGSFYDQMSPAAFWTLDAAIGCCRGDARAVFSACAAGAHWNRACEPRMTLGGWIMTVADATPDFEQVDRDDRAFLGHPKGLGFLGFTEACERFSYYSMQTLLTLYMVNYLLLAGPDGQGHRPRLAAGARLSRA